MEIPSLSTLTKPESFPNDSSSSSTSSLCWVTPFRICLTDIIYRYLQTAKSLEQTPYLGLNWRQRVALCEKFLTWIVGPDQSWSEFKIELDEIHNTFAANVYTSLSQKSVECISTLFEDVDKLLNASADKLRSTNIDNQSPVGVFLRANLIMFKRLSFLQVSKLYKWFVKYISEEKDYTSRNQYESFLGGLDSCISGIDLSTSFSQPVVTSSAQGSLLFSKKQSEFFISKQISLLLQNERKAMSSKELEKVISQLLTSNERQSEVLYLQYLNSLRVRDYTVCLNTLVHYFDSKSNAMGSNFTIQPNEDIAKSFRFAALNLALFNVEMGHWRIAEAAIKEAIMMALDANDMICLQHALMWMEIIKEELSSHLQFSSTSNSITSEFNRIAQSLPISNNLEMNIKTLIQKMLQRGDAPYNVFQLLDEFTSSLVISNGNQSNATHPNLSNSNADLTGVSLSTQYVLQARVWKSYGFTFLSSFYFQLALYSNQSTESQKGNFSVSNPESTCISLSELAGIIKQRGLNSQYSEVIQCLSTETKNNIKLSKHWIVLHYDLCCKDAITSRNSKQLSLSAKCFKMRCNTLFDIYDSVHKYALHNSTVAFNNFNRILDKVTLPDFLIQTHCFMADMYFDSNQYGKAITFHLLPALMIANNLFMTNFLAEIKVKISICHFLLGQTSTCHQVMEENLPKILTEAPVEVRNSVLCWYFKVLLRIYNNSYNSISVEEQKERVDLMDAVVKLAESQLLTQLSRPEIVFRRKEVLLLKALICNLSGFKQESFNLAKQFNVLEKESKSSWPQFILN